MMKIARPDGFIVYKIKNRSPFNLSGSIKNLIRIDYRQVSFDSLLTIKGEHFKTLNFSDALYVIYTKGKEQVEYQNKGTAWTEYTQTGGCLMVRYAL